MATNDIENKQVDVVSTHDNSSRVEITKFSEQSSKDLIVPTSVSVPPRLPDPYFKESIIQFLSRSYPIANFTWTSGSGLASVLLDLDFPRPLFTIPAIVSKLNNFSYFRAGIRVGIRINGSRFHYGKLLCSYIPQFLNSGDSVYSLGVASASPNVIISPTCNEVTEMMIPYCLPLNYIYLPDYFTDTTPFLSLYNIGRLRIHVLNPLRLGAVVPNVDVTVYASFYDVDIAGYTNDEYTPLVAQGDEEALEKSEKGVVSGVLDTISEVATSISRVPLGVASTVAGGVGMLSAGAATLARVMGYCRPLSKMADQQFYLRALNFTHTGGLSGATSLSLTQDNQVAPCHDLMGSVNEDMDFYHYVSTPGLLGADAMWSSADAPASIIISQAVSPMAVFPLQIDIGDIFSLSSTPLSYGTAPFAYWRGSIDYCLQVTASSFHSGRLRILWSPRPVSSFTQVEAANYVSHVMDISTETEFHFTVPYLKSVGWISNSRGLWNTGVVDKTPYYNGYIYILVANTLTHPESPVPPVHLNLWHKAGSDYQVAKLSSNLVSTDVFLAAQGLSRESIRNAAYVPLVPATGTVDDNITMGEKIVSFKDIINRPSPIIGMSKNSVIYVFPFGSPDAIRNPTERWSFAAYSATTLDYFARTFKFSRGSIVVHVLPTPDEGTEGIDSRARIAISCTQDLDGSDPHPQITPRDYKSASGADIIFSFSDNWEGYRIVNNANLMATEAAIPFYSQQYFYNNTYSEGNNPSYYYNSMPFARISCQNHINIYKSAGEDFQYGFMIGPPPITYDMSIDTL